LLLIYRELNILCVKYSLYSPYGDDIIIQDGASSCSPITDTDVGYLCVNFGLPRPLCSRVISDVRDRQTSDRRQTSDKSIA